MLYAVSMVTLMALSVGLKLYVGAEEGAEKGIEATINALPWLALMWLGCYCLFKLGWDILSYRDMPEAIEELAQEIKTARGDLKKRGVIVS
mgnify:CR=1 FL=1